MKIKTQKLSGVALNWAIAVITKQKKIHFVYGYNDERVTQVMVGIKKGSVNFDPAARALDYIQEHRICLFAPDKKQGKWEAYKTIKGKTVGVKGSTPSEAALRLIVFLDKGVEMELPEVLTPKKESK